jgi:hypothetical protein
MNTPRIEEAMNEIQRNIRPYSSDKSTPEFSISEYVKTPNFYGICAFLLFILIIYIRPSTILYEIEDEEGKKVYKISIKKLLATWLVVCLVLGVGIYGYFYRAK